MNPGACFNTKAEIKAVCEAFGLKATKCGCRRPDDEKEDGKNYVGHMLKHWMGKDEDYMGSVVSYYDANRERMDLGLSQCVKSNVRNHLQKYSRPSEYPSTAVMYTLGALTNMQIMIIYRTASTTVQYATWSNTCMGSQLDIQFADAVWLLTGNRRFLAVESTGVRPKLQLTLGAGQAVPPMAEHYNPEVIGLMWRAPTNPFAAGTRLEGDDIVITGSTQVAPTGGTVTPRRSRTSLTTRRSATATTSRAVEMPRCQSTPRGTGTSTPAAAASSREVTSSRDPQLQSEIITTMTQQVSEQHTKYRILIKEAAAYKAERNQLRRALEEKENIIRQHEEAREEDARRRELELEMGTEGEENIEDLKTMISTQKEMLQSSEASLQLLKQQKSELRQQLDDKDEAMRRANALAQEKLSAVNERLRATTRGSSPHHDKIVQHYEATSLRAALLQQELDVRAEELVQQEERMNSTLESKEEEIQALRQELEAASQLRREMEATAEATAEHAPQPRRTSPAPQSPPTMAEELAIRIWEHEKPEMEQRLASLEKELEEARTARNAERDQMQRDLTEAQEARDKALQSNIELQESLGRTRQGIDDTRNDLQAMQNRLKNAEELLEIQDRKLKETTQPTSVTALQKKLEREREQHDTRVKDLQETIRRQNNKIMRHNDAVKELTDDINELTSKLEEKTEDEDQTFKLAQNRQERVDFLEAEVKRLQEDNNDLRGQLPKPGEFSIELRGTRTRADTGTSRRKG